MSDTITFDELLSNIKKIYAELQAVDCGIDERTIFYNANAMADTKERTFKKSRSRSKRIHKKLIKRFGGEFIKAPAIFKFNGMCLAHPAFRADIENMLSLPPRAELVRR